MAKLTTQEIHVTLEKHKDYIWDEDVYQADNTKGWVLNG